MSDVSLDGKRSACLLGPLPPQTVLAGLEAPAPGIAMTGRLFVRKRWPFQMRNGAHWQLFAFQELDDSRG